MQGAERLDSHKESKLTQLGFIRSCAEPSLYFMTKDSSFGLVLVSTVVDDFLITCKDEYVEAIKDKIRSIWVITDGGPVEWFLNLKFSRNRRDGIMKIDQSAYAEQKLREFSLEHDTAPSVPMRTPVRQTDNDYGPRRSGSEKDNGPSPIQRIHGVPQLLSDDST